MVALHASRKCLISYYISPSFLEEKKYKNNQQNMFVTH